MLACVQTSHPPSGKNRERRRRLLFRFFPEGGGDVCTQATKCRLFCGFSGYSVYFSIFSHSSTFTLLHVTYGLLVLALPFRPSFLCLQRNLSPPLNQTKLTKLSDYLDINLSWHTLTVRTSFCLVENRFHIHSRQETFYNLLDFYLFTLASTPHLELYATKHIASRQLNMKTRVERWNRTVRDHAKPIWLLNPEYNPTRNPESH